MKLVMLPRPEDREDLKRFFYTLDDVEVSGSA